MKKLLVLLSFAISTPLQANVYDPECANMVLVQIQRELQSSRRQQRLPDAHMHALLKAIKDNKASYIAEPTLDGGAKLTVKLNEDLLSFPQGTYETEFPSRECRDKDMTVFNHTRFPSVQYAPTSKSARNRHRGWKPDDSKARRGDIVDHFGASRPLELINRYKEEDEAKGKLETEYEQEL